MTEAEKEQRALEAQRILNDDTIIAALSAMRQGGLEQLLQTAASDADTIRRHQAYVGAVDGFVGQLHTFIAAGTKAPARGGIA